jgi:transposase
MTMVCAAGIDVGKDFLDVSIAPLGRTFRASNALVGIRTTVNRLQQAGVTRVVLESIGTYGMRLVRALADAGFDVGIVDPKRIKALRLAEGRHAKTDRLDAELIARFALLMNDAARPIPDAKALEIRALSTRRRQVVEMAAMEKTRLKQALDQEVVESCRILIEQLTAERHRIEEKLQQHLLAEPNDVDRAALLQSIPGIGPAIAMTLMTDFPELGTMDRKAVASLAGLAPHPNESGMRTGARHIQGGRPCVRTALYMAALTAARSNKGFKAEYQALRASGKPAKVALIAIARKLIVAANAILKTGQPWSHPA